MASMMPFVSTSSVTPASSTSLPRYRQRRTGTLHPDVQYRHLNLTPPLFDIPENSLVIFFEFDSVQSHAQQLIALLCSMGIRLGDGEQRRPIFLFNPASLKALDIGILPVQGRDVRGRRAILGEMYLYMGLETEGRILYHQASPFQRFQTESHQRCRTGMTHLWNLWMRGTSSTKPCSYAQ